MSPVDLILCIHHTSSYINPIMFNLVTQLLPVLLPFFIFGSIVDGTSVPTLPIVDLGYELHQASSLDVSTFNNSIPMSSTSSS